MSEPQMKTMEFRVFQGGKDITDQVTITVREVPEHVSAKVPMIECPACGLALLAPERVLPAHGEPQCAASGVKIVDGGRL